MIRVGPLLFVVWFWLVSGPLAILYSINLLLPRRAMVESIRVWARIVVFGLKLFAGVKVEVRGLENCPTGAARAG